MRNRHKKERLHWKNWNEKIWNEWEDNRYDNKSKKEGQTEKEKGKASRMESVLNKKENKEWIMGQLVKLKKSNKREQDQWGMLQWKK